MAGKDYVIAPHRIVDRERGRVMYGTGDRVPLADAVKYGLVAGVDDEAVQPPPDAAPEPTNAKKGRRTRHHDGPTEDR